MFFRLEKVAKTIEGCEIKTGTIVEREDVKVYWCEVVPADGEGHEGRFFLTAEMFAALLPCPDKGENYYVTQSPRQTLLGWPVPTGSIVRMFLEAEYLYRIVGTGFPGIYMHSEGLELCAVKPNCFQRLWWAISDAYVTRATFDPWQETYWVFGSSLP